MADSGNQLKVRLVTPEKVLVDQDVDAVELPSKSGYMEVLYGHAPLLAELGVGEVRLHGGSAGWGLVFCVAGRHEPVLRSDLTDVLDPKTAQPLPISREVPKLGHRACFQ